MIRLRILTEKSIVQTGKHTGWTVEKTITHDPRYIVWMYYNLEKVTFVDSIIQQFPVIVKNPIRKPGVNKEFYQSLFDPDFERFEDKSTDEMLRILRAMRINGKYSQSMQMKYKQRIKKKKDIKMHETVSKAKLQAKNHGR